MATTAKELERFQAISRPAWRDWLAANHATAHGVWLVYFKQATGKPRISYDEAVEEALCFGWIDSRPNTLDDERSMLLFTPRQPGSPWSRLNKRRIAQLRAQGRLAAAGIAAIEAAQADGSWTVYDAIENLDIPADLERALAEHAEARAHFAAFSASTKKQLLWWVVSARRPATRTKRIAELVAAAENYNPLAYPKPPPR